MHPEDIIDPTRYLLDFIKPCPHCRRKVRLSPKTATIVASVDRLLGVIHFTLGLNRATNTVLGQTGLTLIYHGINN